MTVSRLTLTTDAALQLYEMLEDYFEQVESSGLPSDAFNANIDTPAIDLARPRPIDEVRVTLSFAR